jgi:NADH-quinone oxidoreductase subunit J
MNITIVLLIILVVSALWAVMTSLLLRAAIALALTSVILSVILFQMGAPLAAVFELSVCAGLISVVFISVISLTHRLPLKEYLARRQDRILRFWALPLILIVAGIALFMFRQPVHVSLPPAAAQPGVQVLLWHMRGFDLFGQVIVLLAGAFGIVILFKESKNGD